MSIFMIKYNFHYTVRDYKSGLDPFSASRTVYEGTTIPVRTISAFGVLYQLLAYIQQKFSSIDYTNLLYLFDLQNIEYAPLTEP